MNNNFLEEIMRGGACNPDGSQQMSHTSNPFRNFAQNLILGKAAVRQKMEGFYPDEEQQLAHPQHFDQEWEAATKQMKQMNLSGPEMHRIMQEQWMAEQFKMRELEKMAEFEQKRAWEEAQMMAAKQHQEQLMAEKMMGDQWKEAEIQHEAKGWKNDFFQEEYKGMEKDLEDAFKEAGEIVDRSKDEEKVIKESANYMVEVMQNDPDPRFQNSKLLSFLKKLDTGDYQIKENQLIKNVPEGDLEEAWQDENLHKAWAEEEQKIDAQGPEDTNTMFDNIWKKMQAGEYGPPPEDELEEEYKKVMEQMQKMDNGNMEDMFADMWNVEQDIEEYQAYGDVPEAYKFNEGNPYANDVKSLETASNLLNQGNTKNAILALEAHLQRHPNDGNSWRVLGKLHMDNDEDRPAVRCFLNSVNIDGKNLDNLLALGVSCTNILDEVQAMNHLKHWMMNNPKYQNIITDPNIIPENLVGKSLNVEDIKAMNARLLEHFEKARALNPQDPELATSLAVLYFVARDYKASVNLFNEAVKYDPNNYSLWNKLGATLAHLGRADEAMEAYHRALEFKPNYVRAWVNLGIAHAYKGEFDEAARFYLSALSMNPDARHVWSYLQTTLLSLQRYDLLKLVGERDIEGFRQEFDIVMPDELPPPEIEYRDLNEQFLVKEKSENWLKEFNQQ